MYQKRGMLLESLINKTIVMYLRNEVGIFHKKNLDIVFKKVEKENNKLTLQNSYIAKKSTTDYYGLYKGVFIAFEAKSTNLDSLPLSNIKDHQIDYLLSIEKHGGIGFLLIGFNQANKYFLIRPSSLGLLERKSITINWAKENGYEVELTYPGILDFCPIIDLII